VAAAAPERSTTSIILFFITATAVFIGWRLLSKYRHFHRGHKKPRDQKPE
jgi:hypothetical protein